MLLNSTKLSTQKGFLIFNSRNVSFISSNVTNILSHLSKIKLIPSDYALLTIPIITFGLGCWQVQRRKWKLGLIKMIKESMKNDPIDLPKNLIDIKDHEYVKVKVTGTFDHSKEQLIGPRAVKNANKYGGMISLQTSGNVGYHVVTPFLPNDRDYKILVNRGWIHQSKRYDQTRLKNQPKNEVTLVGFVRKTEERPLFGSKCEFNKGVWMYRNIEKIAQSVNCAPFLIEADESSKEQNGPISGQTEVKLRNDHVSYIITWYSLSFLTLCLIYRRIFSRLPYHIKW